MLTFPWELRFKLAVDKQLLSKALRAYLLTLFAWQRQRGRQLGFQGQTGAVTFVQRFGGALNLNPHFHSLLPDGLFVAGDNGPLRFEELPAPTDADIQQLFERLVRRFKRLARRELDPDEQPDWTDEQQSVLTCAAEALRLPSTPSSQQQLWTEPSPTPLCARLAGFSRHAARRVEDRDREGLERLCRYGLRAPFALDRFSLTDDGKVCYRLF